MDNTYYLGIDQGTTGVTAILFNRRWEQAARGYREITQIYPQPGWVEHDAMEVWDAVLAAVREALQKAGAAASEIACLGIDHEGETVVLWDKATGLPVYNAIVWQDRRTARLSDRLAWQYGDLIRQKTGLTADSYFSAVKIKWILDNVPEAAALQRQGRLLAGNMDAWMVYRMTRGRVHVTDASTASRTMLLNLRTGQWDADILELLGIDVSILPEIRDSASLFGKTDPLDFPGAGIPISGLLADQQAAMFGQACTHPGTIKTTYGTGCFMLMNTGDAPVCSANGLLTTVAWRLHDSTTFALDGGIYIAGAAVQWLRDGLKIIQSAGQTEAMALQAGSNGGVYFVPSFTGLAAPHWDSYARGMMIGLTGGTTQAQVVRATLEATAYQVRDVLDAMRSDAGAPITLMRCDGGASANRFLMQFQADILGIPIDVPQIPETSALGAACMAALGIGAFSSVHEVAAVWKPGTHYEPSMTKDERQCLLYNWHRAVDRARRWIED